MLFCQNRYGVYIFFNIYIYKSLKMKYVHVILINLINDSIYLWLKST